jgi:DNA modification methylase
MLPIVGCASEPDDMVIDPFSGSATTGEACLRLGRRYKGVELSKDFAARSRLRLTAAWEEIRRKGNAPA